VKLWRDLRQGNFWEHLEIAALSQSSFNE